MNDINQGYSENKSVKASSRQQPWSNDDRHQHIMASEGSQHTEIWWDEYSPMKLIRVSAWRLLGAKSLPEVVGGHG